MTLSHLHGLPEEAGRPVPSHDRIATRGHVVKRKAAGGVCPGAPLIGADYDGGGHVRMQMTVYKDDAWLVECYRTGVIFRVVTQVKGLGLRQGENIVEDGIPI